MAHQLTSRKNGFIEFAAAGPRSAVWHGLGQYLDQGATIETWKEQAGMDWKINSSPLMYQGSANIMTDESVQILHRSDSDDRLGIVSKDYKIVQPGEVLEFFRDLTEQNKMQLSAAGTLFGGKRFWATAEMGKEAEIVQGDKINGYLLLVSSADGSTATTAKLCSTRVVCNNTLQIALSEKSKNAVRVTHSKIFDPTSVKIDMGLIDLAWESFIGDLRNLANKKMDDDAARDFFAKLITPADQSVNFELMRTQRHVDALMHFFKNGSGAEMSYGTRWGALNAATEMWTHGKGKRDASKQFDDSEMGWASNMKMTTKDALLAMA